jgi:hypothetical protein
MIAGGDELEVIGLGPGGAAPKDIRNPFSLKNARRNVRRQRLAQLAKEERRRVREAATADGERHFRATAVEF